MIPGSKRKHLNFSEDSWGRTAGRRGGGIFSTSHAGEASSRKKRGAPCSFEKYERKREKKRDGARGGGRSLAYGTRGEKKRVARKKASKPFANGELRGGAGLTN